MPLGGCTLLEGSHHKYRIQKIDEKLENEVFQMKRYNHLSNYSTTYKR
jgi:hypothetical protein